jgi:CHAT domain-containing protein
MPKISLEIGQPPQQLDALPNSEEEAILIAALWNTNALVGDQATKVEVLQQMPKARIIHLATHSLLYDMQELGIPGAIALAPCGDDNGFLTAGEILNDLELNAELIVLSACSTGEGKITGDGVIGLSRSFIARGVPSIIVSLWAVGDRSTRLLMSELYQNFQRKLGKAEALRQAMLATKERYPSPKRWAAFTLIGESESLF